jgi:hypothetical protein
MNRSLWIASGCIVLATFGLALGFTLGGEELLAPVVTIFGIMWLVAVHREWQAVTTIAMMVFVAGTAFATWKGFMPGLMLVVLVAGLSAWDLVSMSARFRRVKKEAIEQGIERRHLTRLAAVDGMGLLLGSAGLLLKINLGFGVEILLGLVVAIGLSQLILHLRRSND